jgi:hypothetical protein
MEVTLLSTTLTRPWRAFEEAINGQGRSGAARKRKWGRPERWQHGELPRGSVSYACTELEQDVEELELPVTFHSLGKVNLTLRGRSVRSHPIQIQRPDFNFGLLALCSGGSMGVVWPSEGTRYRLLGPSLLWTRTKMQRPPSDRIVWPVKFSRHCVG